MTARTNKICKNQRPLTDYFTILNKIDLIIKENQILMKSFDNFSKRHFANTNQTLKTVYDRKNNPNLLELLMKASQKKNFDPELKQFGAYLFLICGRRSYGTLCANLPLPKTPTVAKFIGNSERIKEGVLRIAELKKFLQSRNLALKVWVSEDATRITPRVEYDVASNELVGLALPFMENGLPKESFFKITSALQMKAFIEKYEMPSYVYVMMAQPMDVNSPSFCLGVFGTNNKFTNDMVLARWRTIVVELQNHGIEMVGVSSDGDSRLLKAMRKKSELPTVHTPESQLPCAWFQWFFAKFRPDFLCIQDTVHIGGKMRNKLLNSKPLLIGKYVRLLNLKRILKKIFFFV
jgi:hypothetical protein